MRRWNLRSTASSRSCGLLVAPSTITLSPDRPRPLQATLSWVAWLNRALHHFGVKPTIAIFRG